jgi:hypothetical protein
MAGENFRDVIADFQLVALAGRDGMAVEQIVRRSRNFS